MGKGKKMSWFRSTHGAPTDQKYVSIARRAETEFVIVAAVWWALLDAASQATDRGSIASIDKEVLADSLHINPEILEQIIDACKNKGIIDDEDRITHWGNHNPEREDDSRDRVARHRQRQKEDDEAAAEEEKDAKETKYAWQGKVVRLSVADYDTWKKAYSYLDFDAELLARDLWLAELPPSEPRRKRWFVSTSKFFANRNGEAKAKAKRDAEGAPDDELPEFMAD